MCVTKLGRAEAKGKRSGASCRIKGQKMEDRGIEVKGQRVTDGEIKVGGQRVAKGGKDRYTEG